MPTLFMISTRGVECCWGRPYQLRQACRRRRRAMPLIAEGRLRRALGAQRVSQQGHVLRVVPRAVVAEAGADGVKRSESLLCFDLHAWCATARQLLLRAVE